MDRAFSPMASWDPRIFPENKNSELTCPNPNIEHFVMTDTTTFSWQNLYELAREIGDLKPWSYLGLNDYFVVPDAERGENAFVHVWKAEKGSECGVGIYPDEAAFGQTIAIMAGGAATDKQPLCHIRALRLAFLSGRDIPQEERRWLKTQGAYQRCRAGYPFVALSGPRQVPHAAMDETWARCALRLFKRILAVCQAARRKKDAPWDREDMQEAEAFPMLDGWDEQGQPRWGHWTSERDPFESPEPEKPPLDFAASTKLRSLKRSDRCLRMALMMNPEAVDQDEEGALYPPRYLILVIGLDVDEDHEPLRTAMLSPRSAAPFHAQLQDAVARLLGQYGWIPGSVVLWPESFHFAIAPLLDSVDVESDVSPSVLPPDLVEGLPAEFYKSPEDYQREAGQLLRAEDVFSRADELTRVWTPAVNEFCTRLQLTEPEARLLFRILMIVASCHEDGEGDQVTRLNPETVSLVLLEVLLTDIVAPQPVLERLPGLLFDLMEELQARGFVANGREVAQKLRKGAAEYEAKLHDRNRWGPAKQAAVAAADAGRLDLGDEEAVAAFMHAYDERQERSAPSSATPPALEDDLFSDEPEPIRRSRHKVGRNDPCPCGSGKKYKKCCGR